jgi:hypothetical protein
MAQAYCKGNITAIANNPLSKLPHGTTQPVLSPIFSSIQPHETYISLQILNLNLLYSSNTHSCMTEIDLVNAKLITSNCKVTPMTRTPLKYKEILLPLHIP